MEADVVTVPAGMGAFKFSVIAVLRVAQLRRGCVPLVCDSGSLTVTAQREVAAGKIVQAHTPGSYDPRDVGSDRSIRG